MGPVDAAWHWMHWAYPGGNATMAVRITGSFPSSPRCSRISLSTLTQAGTGGASSGRGLPWASGVPDCRAVG
jgi:hypothetical protein